MFRPQNPPGQELNAHGTSLTKRQAKKSERKKQERENGNNDDEDEEDANNGTINNSARFEPCYDYQTYGHSYEYHLVEIRKLLK